MFLSVPIWEVPSSYFGDILIQVRHLVATTIVLKGLGGILFVFGSSFGAYLLVNTPSLLNYWFFSFEGEILLRILLLFLFIEHHFPFKNIFCSFSTWHYQLHYCMTSTTMSLTSQNLIFCCLSSCRFVKVYIWCYILFSFSFSCSACAN